MLLARAAGVSIADVLHERVFGPLNMSDTGLGADPARSATAHRSTPAAPVVWDPPDGSFARPPASDDLSAFAHMLSSGARPCRRRRPSGC